MLHAKFQDHRHSGSGEQGFYRCLLLIAMIVILDKYIEDIQVFGVNMSFISLSEVKKIYIS